MDNHARMLALLCAGLAVSGCSKTYGFKRIPGVAATLEALQRGDQDKAEDADPAADLRGRPAESMAPSVSYQAIPSVRVPEADQVVEASTEPPEGLLTGPDVEASVPPQAIPSFIETVFGQILGVPYSMGAGVPERQDIVTLRTSQTMNRAAFVDLVEGALGAYGLAVQYENGAVKILERTELLAQTPRFIRYRSSASTPSDLRPVVQFVELKASEANEIAGLLRESFPRGASVTITPQPRTNSIVLSGLPDDVAAARQVISALDIPVFAGTTAARIEPVFWPVDELARALNDVLSAQGYQVSNQVAAPRAITILPIRFTNQVLIFSSDRALLNLAVDWARDLDRPNRRGDEPNVFVYDVRNTDAKSLAEVMDQVIGANNQFGQAESAPDNSGNVPSNVQLTVDPIGNRLLIKATPSDYEMLVPLLQRLDEPPREVLIEVLIAEVTLTDNTQYGVEFLLNSLTDNGSVFSIGTGGGLGLGSGGLSGAVINGDARIDAAALASNNQINVLSTPRLVARSGTQASISVGTDVPILTSQRAANSDTSGTTDIVQQVEYRRTGVILDITPIVYGDDRVDIEISQEVSNALANENQAIGSPVISNRTVRTQLSLSDGDTAALGGLIQDQFTWGNTGVPLLKDLPGVGYAFRTETLENAKTELVILITPYVLQGPDDVARIAEAMTLPVERALAAQQGHRSVTLLPPRRQRVSIEDGAVVIDEP